MRVTAVCFVLLLTNLRSHAKYRRDYPEKWRSPTGEIKGHNASVLYMSLEYILGTSSIEWSDIAPLDIKQLFVLFTAG